jgi:hypothetical protein
MQGQFGGTTCPSRGSSLVVRLDRIGQRTQENIPNGNPEKNPPLVVVVA